MFTKFSIFYKNDNFIVDNLNKVCDNIHIKFVDVCLHKLKNTYTEHLIMKILVKEYRKEAGMTKVALASKVGITRQYLAQIEEGGSMPTVPVLYRIAKVFKCTLDDLVQDDELEK